MIAPDKNTVYVYTGPGAGYRSSLSAMDALTRALLPSVPVEALSTEQLLEGAWMTTGCMIVMPGGADVPYCTHLNGHGNYLLRQFVEGGNSYLGLCAGAYYACSRVEFEVGTSLEVKGDRELAFFPGVACGSLYPGFDYASERGAHVVPLTCPMTGNALCLDYVNGGPAFLPNDLLPNDSYQALSCYGERDGALAAVKCRLKQGVAVLCGTHPELDPRFLDDGTEGAQQEQIEKTDSEKHHISELRALLEEDKQRRWSYWLRLLKEAGLAQVMKPS